MLVRAQVRWQRADGTTIEVEETLNGSDVVLGKFWRQRLGFDEGVSWALELYAEKALDRALNRLAQKAKDDR